MQLQEADAVSRHWYTSLNSFINYFAAKKLMTLGNLATQKKKKCPAAAKVMEVFFFFPLPTILLQTQSLEIN